MVVRGRGPVRASSHEGVLLGVAVIALGGTLGTLFAAQPVASLAGIAKFVLAAAGSILAVRLWAPSAREVRWFCSLWLGGAAVSSLWALTFSPRPVGRPLGFSTHPNHLGVVCLLATAIALGFLLSGRPRARALSAVSFPLLAVVLLASGFRAALLGFLVMVPTVAVLSYRGQLAVRVYHTGDHGEPENRGHHSGALLGGLAGGTPATSPPDCSRTSSGIAICGCTSPPSSLWLHRCAPPPWNLSALPAV